MGARWRDFANPSTARPETFLRRAVGAQQGGVFGLQRAQAAHEGVIFGVADAGRILLVIESVMLGDLGDQPGDFGFGAFAHAASVIAVKRVPSSRKLCVRSSTAPMPRWKASASASPLIRIPPEKFAAILDGRLGQRRYQGAPQAAAAAPLASRRGRS